MRRRVAVSVFAIIALLSARAHADAAAKSDYLIHCAGCHGEDGRGLAGHVPSMRGAVAALAAFPEGRRYILGVPGVTQSDLSATQMATVLNWIVRDFKVPGPAVTVVPFTSAEVARARQAPLLDVTATRERLVRRLPPALR